MLDSELGSRPLDVIPTSPALAASGNVTSPAVLPRAQPRGRRVTPSLAGGDPGAGDSGPQAGPQPPAS